MKKQTGIWLDSKEANFIELQDGELVQVHHLASELSSTHAKGGAPAGGRHGGTMTGVSEKTRHHRRQNEEQRYFEEIIEQVNGADEVVIFGPGEAKDLLANAIKAPHSHFSASLMGVLTADKMTEHQQVSYVKSFFEKK